MNSSRTPGPVTGFAVVLLLTLAWSYVRLWLFTDSLLPLTFVVPMLLCVWTRRHWHLWTMAAAFVVVALVKVYVVLPPGTLPNQSRHSFFAATLFNIVVGGAVIGAIIMIRQRLDERNAELAIQNSRLTAQSQELARQNEEIKTQSEELAQQNEEIEAQAEELAGQNEELRENAERLSRREEVLQTLLESTRTPETGRHALGALVRRSLHILGAPAECVAVFKISDGRFRLKVEAAVEEGPKVPAEWPAQGTIGSLVLQRDKTAYVFDLAEEPAVAAPLGTTGPVRSVLATPMRVGGAGYGFVVACSRRPTHWTQEQFRIIEWIAAQCGLIAESLRWQDALSERARQIEAANHAKDQFLAMLSHELRTPLTPVLAAAGVLEHDARLPADVRDDLAMIRRNVGIQSRLVDDLLDLTKLGRGKLELDAQTLDVAALIRETVAIVGPELDAKNQMLVLDLAAAEGRHVRGDGPRLQQVFWNLLRNANKFSPVNTRIEVSAAIHSGPAARLAVVVADEGIGIEPANLHRIFLPFEQIANRAKLRASDGGLGLGLTIAKALVELHGGAISVHSEGYGRGTRFTVELPLTVDGAAAPAETGGRASAPTAAPVAPSARILLVEDHVDTGRVLARLLRNSGYAVEHAVTAAEAFERFERERFDVVVSDLGLPDESGVDLMRRLKARRREVIGICLSGYGMEDDLATCREVGFAEHLTKPVDLQRLRAAIARHCPKALETA
jgi:signal transduction histidine kinase/ActR/RegA family two-component response regulator